MKRYINLFLILAVIQLAKLAIMESPLNTIKNVYHVKMMKVCALWKKKKIVIIFQS